MPIGNGKVWGQRTQYVGDWKLTWKGWIVTGRCCPGHGWIQNAVGWPMFLEEG